MQAGTQILIERMKTNPEEFQEGKGSKWGKALSMANEWLPEDDKKALNEAIRNMRLENFNEEVLRTLAGETEPEYAGAIRYQSTGRYGTGWTDPAGIFGNSAMTLDSSGNLGIGTVSPKMVMQANGDVSIDGDLTVKGNIHVGRT